MAKRTKAKSPATPPTATRVRVSDDGVLVVRSGPADPATEDAIERWLSSLLDGRAVR